MIIPNEDATLIESLSTIDAGCGIANGMIEVISSPGEVAGYSIDRQNYQLSPRFESLEPGDYIIYLLSHDVCLDSAVATIFESPGPTILGIEIMNPACPDALGQIIISAEGMSKLTFSIDGGNTWGTNSNIGSLLPGDYSVIVKDSFGCNDSQLIHISDGPVFALTKIETISSICNSGGQLKVDAIGDSLDYWLNENIYSSNGLFSNLEAGVYQLSIYNKNGCLLNTILSIT